jgi:hypothetical protein
MHAQLIHPAQQIAQPMTHRIDLRAVALAKEDPPAAAMRLAAKSAVAQAKEAESVKEGNSSVARAKEDESAIALATADSFSTTPKSAKKSAPKWA